MKKLGVALCVLIYLCCAVQAIDLSGLERRKAGNLYIGRVWPGESVYVDYTLEAARSLVGRLASRLYRQRCGGNLDRPERAFRFCGPDREGTDGRREF